MSEPTVTFIKYPEGTRHYERDQCTFMKVPSAMYPLNSRNRRCKHSALFTVDGKKLCQLHAGRALLVHHLGEDYDG